MAAAQKKQWDKLKAKKAPVQAKAVKKVAPKRKSWRTVPAVRKAMAKPKVKELVAPVQAAVEPAPTEATA